MNLEQMMAKMRELLDEAKGIQTRSADGSITADDRTRAGILNTEITNLGRDIDKLKGERDNMSQLGQLIGTYSKPAGADPVIDPMGSKHVATRPDAFHQFFETEGYKRVAALGSGDTGHFALSPEMSFYARSNPRGFAAHYPEEARALVYEGATANLILPSRQAGIYRGDPVDKRVRDAFISGRTDGVQISYVSELATVNAAAGFVEATGITSGTPTPAGSAFPESSITFTVGSETVKSIGHMIPVTQEMLMDVPLMETYIRERMTEMLDDKIDLQLMSGAGGSDLTGINNISGISVLDAAYFTANPLDSAGAPGENADRLRRARTYLRLTPRAKATDVLINPFDLEGIQVARDANGNYVYGGSGSNGELGERIGGMNLIETENQTLGIATVVARTGFGVFDRMDTTVQITDANRNWFEHRILALAVWARIAFVPFRPATAAKVTLL